jgi:hypothetical protein
VFTRRGSRPSAPIGEMTQHPMTRAFTRPLNRGPVHIRTVNDLAGTTSCEWVSETCGHRGSRCTPLCWIARYAWSEFRALAAGESSSDGSLNAVTGGRRDRASQSDGESLPVYCSESIELDGSADPRRGYGESPIRVSAADRPDCRILVYRGGPGGGVQEQETAVRHAHGPCRTSEVPSLCKGKY